MARPTQQSSPASAPPPPPVFYYEDEEGNLVPGSVSDYEEDTTTTAASVARELHFGEAGEVWPSGTPGDPAEAEAMELPERPAFGSPEAYDTRLTPEFVQRHLQGRNRAPFVSKRALDSHENVRFQCLDRNVYWSHEEASDTLKDIAEGPPPPTHAYEDIVPELLMPLIDYIVMWLKFRTPSRRTRYRHLSYVLAMMLRYNDIHRRVATLRARRSAREQLLHDAMRREVEACRRNTRSFVLRGQSSYIAPALTSICEVSYLINMDMVALQNTADAMRRRCGHVAKIIDAALDAEAQAHVKPADYLGVVTRVQIAPGLPDRGGTCVVCLEDLGDDKKPRAVHRLACGHRFHPTCIYHHLVCKGTTTQCPHCRFETMAK